MEPAELEALKMVEYIREVIDRQAPLTDDQQRFILALLRASAHQETDER